MDLQNRFKFLKHLENPKYPLLGPNIMGLYCCGLWQVERNIHNCIFLIIHFLSVLFVMSLYVELYRYRSDVSIVFFNTTLAVLSSVSICKTVYFINTIPKWVKLVNNISDEEMYLLHQKDPKIIELMMGYTAYSRMLTYGYWFLVVLTQIATILSPFLKYFSVPVYREMVKNGTEPYPQILLSYFPFDKTTSFGYMLATGIQISMVSQGAAVIMFYDSTAVSVLAFFKGYMMILKTKCQRIFGEQAPIRKHQILSNIRECHRMHNFFIEQHRLFNALLSPVMFLYVLVCSMAICFSVVQLSMDDVSISQKLWVIEFALALSFQLFLYCWHSNEMMYESSKVSDGIYDSNWWRADVAEKKELLLLAGKLSPFYIIDAGPFTSFSIATFIDIMKGAYSFYTLFTQMQENV